jgi:Na+/glutamate symporter
LDWLGRAVYETLTSNNNMADSSVSKPILQAEQQTDEVEMKAERRQLVWRFLLSFGVIASTITAATMIAHWMRPMP